jgi:hypothetical protein
MYRSAIYGMPTRCVNRNCRASFYRDCHKGWLPKSELEVYAIMKCHVCRDVFMVAQMINMVHEYKENLPEREEKPNEIKIFTDLDQIEFRKELYSDENPLFNLYDGYYPGATDTPEDVQ